MNAVVTLTRKESAAEKGKPRAAPPSKPGKQINRGVASKEDAIKPAFAIVEVTLQAASATDERHEWSGDSDRLLRIAHTIAGEAATHLPETEDVEGVAFDIAALVRAAKLVPGDVESDERRESIEQAAVQLNWLTGCDEAGSNCIDPRAPRGPSPVFRSAGSSACVEAPTAAPAKDSERARDLANAAICHIEAAKGVLDLLQDSDVPDEVYAVSRLMEMLWDTGSDLDEVTDIGLPYLGPFADFQRELCILIAITDLVRLKEDGQMCAVVYLLRDASPLMEEALMAIPKLSEEVQA
ncbi:MAG: hypothetical protein EOO23_00360 [Comamonadaceae bacterium]|nr:MAG: hypothetical protein EOO23_00360 [Comamonadaceae bacterium]